MPSVIAHLCSYIFVQILFNSCTAQSDIAECQPVKAACNISGPYRNYDGSCNNLNQPKWGMSVTPYRRILKNSYSDGILSMPVAESGQELPLARHVSNVLNPVGDKIDPRYTLSMMQFGQMVAHDLSFTAFGGSIGLSSVDCCTFNGQLGSDADDRRCAPLLLPPDDPIYKQTDFVCMPFNFERTLSVYDTGCLAPGHVSNPITFVTGYADLSVLYGQNEAVAKNVRTFLFGRLKVDIRGGQQWPQRATNSTTTCNLPRANDVPCYGGGDVRLNQNPQLTVIHTALLRHHNKIAAELFVYNPLWGDEKIYQEARRINIAMYQHIIYTEYVPKLIGHQYAESKNIYYPSARYCVDDYNPKLDASVSVEFATAAFRSPHSMIAGNLKLLNNKYEAINTARLSDNFGSPKILERKLVPFACEVGYDYLIRGLSNQPMEYLDEMFDEEIKHYLFRGGKKFGSDLRSVDIQRQRDHGVGSYVEARRFCNLSVPDTFDDLLCDIDQKDVDKLKIVYENIEDIDLNTGGLLERPAPNSLVGPTFRCFISEQFYRTRAGDRFFYENCECNCFTKRQLKTIKEASLACLLCDTSSCVKEVPSNVFEPIGSRNRLENCNELCDYNFSAWKTVKLNIFN